MESIRPGVYNKGNKLKEVDTMSKVKVYVTDTCPYCTMMTNYLEHNGIDYEAINVQKDPIAAQRLVEATGQMGVPQTEINGQWVLGFDPDSLQAALKG